MPLSANKPLNVAVLRSNSIWTDRISNKTIILVSLSLSPYLISRYNNTQDKSKKETAGNGIFGGCIGKLSNRPYNYEENNDEFLAAPLIYVYIHYIHTSYASKRCLM